MNAEADKLAVRGALGHSISPVALEAAKWRLKLGRTLHKLMLATLTDRRESLPLPERREGYSEAALERLANIFKR